MTNARPKTVLVARSLQAPPIHHPGLRATCQIQKAFVPGRKEERFPTELPIKLEGAEGVAHNVSANGIYFVTDAALHVGQPVMFTMEFVDFPSGPIAVNCVARVVRLEERGAQLGVGASISSFEFHRIRPGRSSH